MTGRKRGIFCLCIAGLIAVAFSAEGQSPLIGGVEQKRQQMINRTEKSLAELGRTDVYAQYLKEYGTIEWTKKQFPGMKEDSLELARLMFKERVGWMALMYTPAEIARLKEKGLNVIHYYVEKRHNYTPELLLYHNEETVILKPIRAELKNLGDGYMSNGLFTVVEVLKGSLKKGDTVHVRQHSSTTVYHPRDVIHPNAQGDGPWGKQFLAFLTRVGAAQHVHPDSALVALPPKTYYNSFTVEIAGDKLLIEEMGIDPNFHFKLVSDARKYAKRF